MIVRVIDETKNGIVIWEFNTSHQINIVSVVNIHSIFAAVCFDNVMKTGNITLKAQQTLMSYNIFIAIVKIADEPWICMIPSAIIASTVKINHLLCRHACCNTCQTKKNCG
jgi:hypothetical protein